MQHPNTNLGHHDFDPFRGLVAQVTNVPFIDGGHGQNDGFIRSVHNFMSQDDEVTASAASGMPSVPNQSPKAATGVQGMKTTTQQVSAAPVDHHHPSSRPSRQITLAEKSLISKVHGYMPALQLLGILNERLRFDLGPTATAYTMDQLKAEIDANAVTLEDGPSDWSGMRKLLNKARKSGVLSLITAQLINDFAVVYSLNTKQVLLMKDVLLNTEGE